MRKSALTAFLFLLLSLFISCGNSKSNSFKTIPPEKAAKLMKNGIIVMDVRTPEEYDLGHINGSVNYNFMSRDFFKKIETLDKTHPYIICSRDGRTGKIVSRVLTTKGFKKIFNIENGIVGWSEAGFKLTKKREPEE